MSPLVAAYDFDLSSGTDLQPSPIEELRRRVCACVVQFERCYDGCLSLVEQPTSTDCAALVLEGGVCGGLVAPEDAYAVACDACRLAPPPSPSPSPPPPPPLHHTLQIDYAQQASHAPTANATNGAATSAVRHAVYADVDAQTADGSVTVVESTSGDATSVATQTFGDDGEADGNDWAVVSLVLCSVTLLLVLLVRLTTIGGRRRGGPGGDRILVAGMKRTLPDLSYLASNIVVSNVPTERSVQ